MSAASIQVGQPNPFKEYPTVVIAPFTRVQHIPAASSLPSSGTQTLSAGQVVGPLVVSPSVAVQNIVLPSAQTILDAYGSASQVQVGDYIVIQVYNLGFGQNEAAFLPGSGGSGSGSVLPGFGTVSITFTNTTYGSAAYTIA